MNDGDPNDVARRLRALGRSRALSTSARADALDRLCGAAQRQCRGRAGDRGSVKRRSITTLARLGLIAATLAILVAPRSPADVQLGPSLGRGARLLLEHFTRPIDPMHR